MFSAILTDLTRLASGREDATLDFWRFLTCTEAPTVDSLSLLIISFYLDYLVGAILLERKLLLSSIDERRETLSCLTLTFYAVVVASWESDCWERAFLDLLFLADAGIYSEEDSSCLIGVILGAVDC